MNIDDTNGHLRWYLADFATFLDEDGQISSKVAVAQHLDRDSREQRFATTQDIDEEE